MSTINDLCVTTSISDDDKLVVWKNSDGVTRSVPASVLASYVQNAFGLPLPISLGGTNATTATQATSNLQFLQGGAGSVARSLTSKFQENLSVKDFGTTVTNATLVSAVNAAQVATSGGTVQMPNGDYSTISMPVDYSNVSLAFNGPNVPVSMFGEPPGVQFYAAVARKQMDSTSHAGRGHSSFHVEAHPKGSGLLGPLNADYGLTVGLVKQNVGTGTETAGEMDGMYIGVRNGGASQSDTTGFLADIANYGSGFNALYEGAVSTFSGTTQTARVVNQRAVINNRDGVTYGDVVINNIGPMTVVYYVRNTASLGATVGSLMQYGNDVKGTTFDMPILNDAPYIKLYDVNGTTSGIKWIQAFNNSLRILNTAGTAEILKVDDSGNTTTAGNLTTGGITASGPTVFSGTSNAFSVRPTFNGQVPYDTGNVVAVANGGTGSSSLAANYTLIGNGSSAIGGVAPGASGTLYASNGPSSSPSFQTLAALGIVQTSALPSGLTAYTPTITSGSGAFTTVSATGGYSTIGKLVFFRLTVTITTNGTAAGSVKATLPFTVANTNGDLVVFAGRANATGGAMLQGFAAANSNSITIVDYANNYPGANGQTIVLSGCYLST